MKKVFYVSGVLSAVLLVLLLTGWAGSDYPVNKALRRGNLQYESGKYGEALASYEAGLSSSSSNKELNFNAAQAAYLLGAYEKAVDYYGKSDDIIEKFINTGNMYYRAGDAAEDQNQKAQAYLAALESYHEGIINFPEDLSLKYNYEFVKEKLEDLISEMEPDSNDQNDEGDTQDNETGDSESSDGYDSSDSEGDSDSTDSSDNSAEQQNAEELDMEAIERILQMLESQEEESLKNNQEIMGRNEGKYGWENTIPYNNTFNAVRSVFNHRASAFGAGQIIQAEHGQPQSAKRRKHNHCRFRSECKQCPGNRL